MQGSHAGSAPSRATQAPVAGLYCKSRRAAAQSLRQKGLAPAEVASALEAVYAPEDGGDDPELEAAAALVDSRYRKKLAIGRRDLVVAALQRRGFAYPVIKEAIRRVEEEEQRL